MVIEIHGFPGSGKTTVLTMIAQRSLQGKETLGIPPCDTVLTSFPCPGCYELDFELLGKRNFKNCLMILDEVSMYADSRHFRSFSDSLLYFFKFHRHHNINLVWASQSASDADKKIREVTQCSYIIDRYFFLTAIKPILKQHTVKSGEPDIKFELAPPIMWQWCFRPRWYKYFDSYAVRELPEPELRLWSELPVGLQPRKTFADKFRYLLSNLKDIYWKMDKKMLRTKKFIRKNVLHKQSIVVLQEPESEQSSQSSSQNDVDDFLKEILK